MASVLTHEAIIKKSTGRRLAGGFAVSQDFQLPAGVGVSAIIRHARPIAAVVAAAVTIIRTAAVIDRTAAVVTIGIVIVATVLRCGDREAGADDAGKGSCRGRTAAAAIIAPT